MSHRGRPPHPDILTPRQWEVLALIRDGCTDQQIADRLGISLGGAKYHVSEILSRLGVETREEAARWRPRETGRIGWGLFWKAAAAALATIVVLLLGLLAWGAIDAPKENETDAGLISDETEDPLATDDDPLASSQDQLVFVTSTGNVARWGVDESIEELTAYSLRDSHVAFPEVSATGDIAFTEVKENSGQDSNGSTSAFVDDYWATSAVIQTPNRTVKLKQAVAGGWSPDGTQLAIIDAVVPDWAWTGRAAIYTLHSDEVVHLSGTGTVESVPQWSPDGSRIGFIVDYTLSIVETESLERRVVLPDIQTFVWSPDGSAIATMTTDLRVQVRRASDLALVKDFGEYRLVFDRGGTEPREDALAWEGDVLVWATRDWPEPGIWVSEALGRPTMLRTSFVAGSLSLSTDGTFIAYSDVVPILFSLDNRAESPLEVVELTSGKVVVTTVGYHPTWAPEPLVTADSVP